jgi:hypothetical protein
MRNQKGFGLVEGLLVIIALTLVVGVGFYIANSNKEKGPQENANATNNTQSGDTSTKSADLNAAVEVAKDYYQFRYIEKWNQQVSKDELTKWLTPSLIAQLSSEGYQGGADIDNINRGGGFTIPDDIEVKGLSSDGETATVELTFVYRDNLEGSPKLDITLEASNNGWLISKAQSKL